MKKLIILLFLCISIQGIAQEYDTSIGIIMYTNIDTNTFIPKIVIEPGYKIDSIYYTGDNSLSQRRYTSTIEVGNFCYKLDINRMWQFIKPSEIQFIPQHE